MKLSALIFLLAFHHPVIKDTSAAQVLQRMYARYHGTWQKSLTFDQATLHYRNDSLVKTDTWYETIVYPDLMRIDIGSAKSTTGIIFRNDSSYAFKNNKITKAAKDENELMFFLGGMYFVPFEKVQPHFAALHYDLSKMHIATWKGRPVYVLGIATADEKANQLWIDQQNLVAVRFIKYDGGVKEEGTFEQQIPLKGGWSETLCKFYINDKMIQKEIYHNVVANEKIDMSIFDPDKYH